MTDEPVPVIRAAQRTAFVRAFLDQAWARPGLDRPVSRVHVAVLVAIGSLIVAIVVGVVLQFVSPVSLADPPPAAPPPPTGSYAAVSGWDCAIAADHGFDIGGRTATWYTVPQGGWPSDGCHGTFEAIPLSGKADRYDQGQVAVWWFNPGDMRTCELAVYLPTPERPGDAAVMAARYTALSGRSGGALASFVVDQTAIHGGWRILGTLPVTDGGIAVRLDNQGVPRSAADRLAITQVRARCNEAN